MSAATPAPDPLSAITLTRAQYVGVVAIAALVAGLVLALLPAHVTAPTIVHATVSCGNVFGGVEAGSIVDGLKGDDRPVTVEYIAMCERALDCRTTSASLLFFGGFVVMVGLGVVRRQ